MKTLTNPFARAIACSALLFLFITACKKDNNSTPTPGTTTGISATVNGNSAFQSTAVSADSGISYEGYIILVGTQLLSGDTVSMEVDLTDTIEVNKPCAFKNGSGLSYYSTKAGKGYHGDPVDGHGTVTITSLDPVSHKIQGSFSGTLINDTDSIVVSNGTFNSTYQVKLN